MKVLLVCLAIIVVVSGSCLNECNSHGVCEPVTFTCDCEHGWTGQDCSTFEQDLEDNVPIEGLVVNTRQWNYFHIEAKSDRSDLVVEVNQTSLGGDCDTYVRLGDLPTRSVYDFRDISTGQDARLEIEHPAGVYYIGVYGFLSAHYNIKAYLKTDCPNDCTGHGTCEWDAVSNGPVCVCNSGWFGDYCSYEVVPLTNDTDVSGSVEKREWAYYSFVNTLNTFTVELTQGDASEEDCDLYVRYGDIPSQVKFDYRDVSVNTGYSLQVTEATSGTYFLGVYGFKQCTYQLKYYSYNMCPNNCSGSSHGTCRDDGISCECALRFTGDGCETMLSPLAFDSPMTGFVSDNSWNYYHFQISGSGAVIVNVVQDSPSMDCDLYIRYAEEPTRLAYDYRHNSFETDMTIEVEDPESGDDYYIGVFGYKECSYTLTTQMSQECPEKCEEHGSCHNGRCDCNDGWAGDDCSVEATVLQLAAPLKEEKVVNGEWRYYSFEAVKGYDVIVLLRELGDDIGSVWLYQARDQFPSLGYSDNSDNSVTHAVHSIQFTPLSDMTVYLGVYGSPVGVEGDENDYELEVWQGRKAE